MEYYDDNDALERACSESLDVYHQQNIDLTHHILLNLHLIKSLYNNILINKIYTSFLKYYTTDYREVYDMEYGDGTKKKVLLECSILGSIDYDKDKALIIADKGGGGNCLFHCICCALNQIFCTTDSHYKYTPDILRELVATLFLADEDCISDIATQINMYSSIQEKMLPELEPYKILKNWNTSNTQQKNIIKKTLKTAMLSSTFWGDWLTFKYIKKLFPPLIFFVLELQDSKNNNIHTNTTSKDKLNYQQQFKIIGKTSPLKLTICNVNGIEDDDINTGQEIYVYLWLENGHYRIIGNIQMQHRSSMTIDLRKELFTYKINIEKYIQSDYTKKEADYIILPKEKTDQISFIFNRKINIINESISTPILSINFY